MEPNIEHLTDASDERSLVRPGLGVIDFWAGWCGPCRMMAPQFEKASALRPDYHVAKIDVDAAPGLAGRSGIRSIPTLAVLRDGKLVAMESGVMGAEELIEALDRIAADPELTGRAAADERAAA